MAYRTQITDTVFAMTRVVPLTRGRSGREHTVYGLPFRARVWEDMHSLVCTVYVNDKPSKHTSTPHQAYAWLLRLAEEGMG